MTKVKLRIPPHLYSVTTLPSKTVDKGFVNREKGGQMRNRRLSEQEVISVKY